MRSCVFLLIDFAVGVMYFFLNWGACRTKMCIFLMQLSSTCISRLGVLQELVKRFEQNVVACG